MSYTVTVYTQMEMNYNNHSLRDYYKGGLLLHHHYLFMTDHFPWNKSHSVRSQSRCVFKQLTCIAFHPKQVTNALVVCHTRTGYCHSVESCQHRGICNNPSHHPYSPLHSRCSWYDPCWTYHCMPWRFMDIDVCVCKNRKRNYCWSTTR